MNKCECKTNHRAERKACPCPCEITLRTKLIPANLGTDAEGQAFAPALGAEHNMIVHYQANGAVYIYDSNGEYTNVKPADGPDVAEKLELLENRQEQLYDPAVEYAQVASYADLQTYDITGMPAHSLIRVDSDETHGGEASIYYYNPATAAWVYAFQATPYYVRAYLDERLKDLQADIAAVDVAKLNALAPIKRIGENLELTDEGVLNATGGGSITPNLYFPGTVFQNHNIMSIEQAPENMMLSYHRWNLANPTSGFSETIYVPAVTESGAGVMTPEMLSRLNAGGGNTIYEGVIEQSLSFTPSTSQYQTIDLPSSLQTELQPNTTYKVTIIFSLSSLSVTSDVDFQIRIQGFESGVQRYERLLPNQLNTSFDPTLLWSIGGFASTPVQLEFGVSSLASLEYLALDKVYVKIEKTPS